jgi:hypothetical protein
LLLTACTPQEPEFVYVPAENYQISVHISVPGEARAGEWIPLSAERRSGPWKRVRRGDAPPGLVPFGAPPAEYEKEVAANLHWITEPAGAQFDVPLTQTNERKVRFDKPGNYRVWARNAYPTEAKSNVVTLTVK